MESYKGIISLFNIMLLWWCRVIFAETCDTLAFGSIDTVIECVKSNCPEDSVITIYRTNGSISKTHFKGCSDTSIFYSLNEYGDTVAFSQHINKKTVGLRRFYYSESRPKRFTHYNDSGSKHGWEVFWYENGNVKDSILFRNDSTIQRASYYQNGQLFMREKDIYGGDGYDAVSYNPAGEKTGEIHNGTGTVFVCDSVGSECHELIYKNGKRVFE
jgi:antitoxin component YwqK of YwqJK toxin-antitoxin module